MQQLSFESLDKKVEIAIERLKMFEPPEGYYVAISGGKDSTVVYDLVKKACVKADFHYSVTNLDAPETVRFIKKYMPDVQFDYPEICFWKLLVKKKIPPTRLIRWCCAELKEKGGEDRIVVTGVRKQESIRRRKRDVIEVCYKQRKRFVHPIIDWSDIEVWEYIRQNGLPYNPLYDRGYKRIGCLMCPMSPVVQREREMEEYPYIRKLFMKAFDRLYQEVYKDRECNWKSGADIFNWWVYGNPTKDSDEATLSFFED